METHTALRLAVCALVCCFAAACAPASDAERAAWLADFAQLEQHVADVYANLDWAMVHLDVDPYALSQEARASLNEARTGRGARKAVEQFVAAFKDPHFFVQKGTTRGGGGGGESEGIDPKASALSALKSMGFKGRNLDFRVKFQDLPGFERVNASPENPFAAGTFQAGDHKVGVLRIAHFGEDGYPDIAEPMWSGFAQARTEPCDLWCQWEFQFDVMDELLRHVQEATAALRQAGIEALVVDISDNGGGSDWAGVAPRILAPPLKRCPQAGLIKHPHHGDRMRRRLEGLDELLARLDLTPDSRRMLQAARNEVQGHVDELEQPCNRLALFRQNGARVSCGQIVRTSGCGLVPYLPPGSLAELEEDRDALFSPLRFDYTEGVWTGPLFVVMDGETASASEQFVALLEANEAAVLLGQKTRGAGCGFIGGGVPAYLENIGVTVRMPDCVRFRADGRNELAGIEPHVELEWGGSNGDRARAVATAVAKRLGS